MGVTNTVADAISRLYYDPKVNPNTVHSFLAHTSEETGVSVENIKWKNFISCLAKCSTLLSKQENLVSDSCMTYQHVFANRGKEGEIFPPTVSEIADLQRDDTYLRKILKRGGKTTEIAAKS